MGKDLFIFLSVVQFLLTFVTNVNGGALSEKFLTAGEGDDWGGGEGGDWQGGEGGDWQGGEGGDWEGDGEGETDGKDDDWKGDGGEGGEWTGGDGVLGFVLGEDGEEWRRRWWCKGKWIELVVHGPKPSHCRRRRPTGKRNAFVLWRNPC